RGADVAPGGLALDLRPVRPCVLDGEPRLTLTLVNQGPHTLTLVEPGDGSNEGWRTPVLTWSPRPPDYARCGNISPLKPGEVFTLEPGQRKVLGGWARPPLPLPPGRHKLSVCYENVPHLRWSGLGLGEHDPETMDRVRRSDRVRVVSN